MNSILERAPLFVLVLIRFSGLILVAPFFSSPMINNKVKVLLTVVCAVMFTSVLPPVVANAGSIDWIRAAACELAVGLVLGLGSRIAFSAASMAGELMGLQMGVGAAALFDPNTEAQVSPLEQFYSGAFLAVFIVIDGPHHMLRAMRESFSIVAFGGTPALDSSLELLLAQTASMLACGCRVAAPVVAPLFMLSLAVALVSRAYPQMNVFSLSYGVSILAGMALLAATMPGMRVQAEELLRNMDRFALKALQVLSAISGGLANG